MSNPNEQSHGQTKKCPKCQEDIQLGAKNCKHCGADLRNWFVRHKIITGILILFVIGIIGSAMDGGENNKQTNSNSTATINESSPKTEDKEVPSKPKEWYEVQTFSGKGNQDTSSFTISGDKVKITAATSGGSSGIGTYSSVSLESDNGSYLGAGLSISTEGAEDGHGETTYRNLKPGDYYISVISGVNWEVKVEEYR